MQGLVAALGGQDALRPVTGLPLSTYFSGAKLRWLMDNVPAVKAGVAGGTALFGTVDTWLVWHLTGGAAGVANGTTAHVTDVTNASRTLLMDLGAAEWHDETIKALGLGAVRSLVRVRVEVRVRAKVKATRSKLGLELPGRHLPPSTRAHRPRAGRRAPGWG